MLLYNEVSIKTLTFKRLKAMRFKKRKALATYLTNALILELFNNLLRWIALCFHFFNNFCT